MGLGCKSGPKVVPNGSSENYYKVSNGHVIEHVLVGQNRGSTSPTLMLIIRVKRWSLTYCRCLGIKFQSQKSGVKSEELVVERSLKLNALNLDWLGVIDGPLLHGHFRKQYLKHCTPT